MVNFTTTAVLSNEDTDTKKYDKNNLTNTKKSSLTLTSVLPQKKTILSPYFSFNLRIHFYSSN